jgi:hypothetical protein
MIANAELKMAPVMRRDPNPKFNNAAGSVGALGFESFHVHHVGDAGWLGSVLNRIAAETMRTWIVHCGPYTLSTLNDS